MDRGEGWTGKSIRGGQIALIINPISVSAITGNNPERNRCLLIRFENAQYLIANTIKNIKVAYKRHPRMVIDPPLGLIEWESNEND